MGDRGIFSGGLLNLIPEVTNVISYITISTTGNASDFGDLIGTTQKHGGASNGRNDRGVFAGGQSGASNINVIQYITISTTSNTSDFGDLTVARQTVATTSNAESERAICGGGTAVSLSNIIDYFTINSAGNASDFGDLSAAREYCGAVSNGISNRGVFGGGIEAGVVNTIEYVTITSTGNTTDFGDLAQTPTLGVNSCSNFIYQRGLFSSIQNDYITINTTGNAALFGSMSVTRQECDATSNGIDQRGVFAGGSISGDRSNIIDYVTISTTGNAADFGDLTHAVYSLAATSNADGGNTALNKWMNILETNIPKMLGVDRATTQLSKLMSLTLTDYSVALGDIGIFNNGFTGLVRYNIIDYITISSAGNATDFGDLSQGVLGAYSTSNGGGDRGVIIGGSTGSLVNNIEYITISSPSNSSDFGDVSSAIAHSAAVSNRTNNRGVFALGYTGSFVNNIEYITINSAGNSSDFGDTTLGRALYGASCNNNTRGIFCGGYSGSRSNVIDYITISSAGNATDFGDLVTATFNSTGSDNGENDRGVIARGKNASDTVVNDIDYVTISSTGNASDFGDLTVSRCKVGSCSNKTNNRGVFAGGDTTPTSDAEVNTIDYINISATGNASDFGDLTASRDYVGGTSNT